ncbi:MAG: hypothetical protein Q8R26_01725 [bacterium]|nr:hypothetical protein [bacterium]
MGKYIFILILVVAIAGIGWAGYSYKTTPGPLDTFAQCLSEKGVMFYGAFWCPHCQEQKRLFGKSQKLLPYTECSTPDGKGQLQVCVTGNITSYPTWEFSDKTRELRVMTPVELSEKTGCVLPQE